MDLQIPYYNIIFDSDDDDEPPPARRIRFIRVRFDHFTDLDDLDFVKRFRLSKGGVFNVLEMIDHHLEFSTDKNAAVSPINHLLLCLRFYATGCTQLSASDFSGVSESTAHRIVHRVTAAIASLYADYIYFPRTSAETQTTQREFYRIARFPRVIGAIDCTHIKICSPGGENAEYYRNRKGYFSLSCQRICNANLEFLDVVARWPGCVHDQTIFDNCFQRNQFEAGNYGEGLLLGDSAYANRRYMMTPLLNLRTAEETLYNVSQIRSRNPVERIFGIWKRRFPVVALGINVRLEKAMPIIIATAVLHNILRRAGEPVPSDDNLVQLPVPWETLIERGRMNNGPAGNQQAVRDPHRRAIINDYFKTLHAMNANNTNNR